MENIEIFFLTSFYVIHWCNGALKPNQAEPQKSPCVLQDIIPFGAAALLTITFIHIHTKQGNGYR